MNNSNENTIINEQCKTQGMTVTQHWQYMRRRQGGLAKRGFKNIITQRKKDKETNFSGSCSTLRLLSFLFLLSIIVQCGGVNNIFTSSIIL